MDNPKPSYSYLEVLERIVDCDTAEEMEYLMDIIQEDKTSYSMKQQKFIGRALKEKYFRLRLGEII